MPQDSTDYNLKLFSKLMLVGNICVAIHLVTEHAGRGVSNPDIIVTIG